MDESGFEVRRLRQILDGMSELVCRFRPDGIILYVNEPYCRMFGKTQNELVGHTYAPVVHPDDLERIQAEVAAMTPDNPTVTIENRVVTATGGVTWTQWTNRGTFNEAGELVECQSAGRDINELRLSLERTDFLAEASSVLVGSLDLEETLGRLVSLSVPFLADSCAVNLLDERQERLQRLVTAHVDPEVQRQITDAPFWAPTLGDARPLAERAIAGEPTLVPELLPAHLEEVNLDDEHRRTLRILKPYSFMLVPLVARGRTLGAMSFTSSRAHSRRRFGQRDFESAIELGRRAGMAIENARLFGQLEEAHRRKDTFLATLGHELRNPLAALASSIDALALSEDPAVRRRALDVARRQVVNQGRLVDDLLEITRFVRGRVELRREQVELRQAVSALVDGYRSAFAARRQRFSVDELPRAPVYVLADPTRLDQMVGNLLDNASKYSSEGGAVVLSLAVEEGSAAIRVSDEGAGLSTEELEMVFDPFVQARSGHGSDSAVGLGLGLTIVRELARLHGGSVRAHSAGSGRGSVFEVRLPVSEFVAPPAGQRHVAEAGPGGDISYRRVLVVDDNVDAADMLAETIRLFGCDVRVAYGGSEAVAAAPDYDPDLALVDLGMPGMNGFATARALRETGGGRVFPIVALSGYAQASDIAASAAAGFDLHLAKPLKLDRLRSLLGGRVRREC
jgi:PAS domain S-box-containing protein